MELLLGLVLIGIVWAMSKSTDWKFDSYTPPQGQRIDKNAQMLDMTRNHLTEQQVMQNTINGKYNVKDFM